MASGIISSNKSGVIRGKANIPTKLAEYTGVTTDTAEVNIDNKEKTFAVDVLKVPGSLTVKTNDIHNPEVTFDGSEDISLSVYPISLVDTESYFYTQDSTKEIYRGISDGNISRELFYVDEEIKNPINSIVDVAVANNTSIASYEKFVQSFEEDISSLVGAVYLSNIYGNKYIRRDDEEIILNAIRLGANKSLGTLVLHLNYPITKISFEASKYFGINNETGEITGYDTNAELFVNDEQVIIREDFSSVEVNFEEPTQTIILQNRLSEGTKGGRVFIRRLVTYEQGISYIRRYLATRDNIVDLSTAQEIHGFKDFEDGLYVNNQGNYIGVSTDAIYTGGYLEKYGDFIAYNFDSYEFQGGSIELNNTYINIHTSGDDCYVTINNQSPDSAFIQISGLAGDNNFEYRLGFDGNDLYSEEEEQNIYQVKLPTKSGKLATLDDVTPKLYKYKFVSESLGDFYMISLADIDLTDEIAYAQLEA